MYSVSGGAAKIEKILPTYQSLLDAGLAGNEIRIFLKNYPSLSCMHTKTCAAEAEERGLSIRFGASTGHMTSLSDIDEMLLVTMLPSRQSSAGKIVASELSRHRQGRWIVTWRASRGSRGFLGTEQ